MYVQCVVTSDIMCRPIRGMSAVVMGAGPAHACFFATYEYCKHSLAQLTRHRHDHITHGQSRVHSRYTRVYVRHRSLAAHGHSVCCRAVGLHRVASARRGLQPRRGWVLHVAPTISAAACTAPCHPRPRQQHPILSLCSYCRMSHFSCIAIIIRPIAHCVLHTRRWHAYTRFNFVCHARTCIVNANPTISAYNEDARRLRV